MKIVTIKTKQTNIHTLQQTTITTKTTQTNIWCQIGSLRTAPHGVKPRPASLNHHVRSALLWYITQWWLVIPYRHLIIKYCFLAYIFFWKGGGSSSQIRTVLHSGKYGNIHILICSLQSSLWLILYCLSKPVNLSTGALHSLVMLLLLHAQCSTVSAASACTAQGTL